ncbi:MAG: hypothetical protein ACLPWG_03675 [Steroidobacteraceae bacterium]
MSDWAIGAIAVVFVFAILVLVMRGTITHFAIGLTKDGVTATADAKPDSTTRQDTKGDGIDITGNSQLGVGHLIRAVGKRIAIRKNTQIGSRNTIEAVSSPAAEKTTL